MKDGLKILFNEEWMLNKKYAVSYPLATFYYASQKEALDSFRLLANYYAARIDPEEVIRFLDTIGYYVIKDTIEHPIGIYCIQ